MLSDFKKWFYKQNRLLQVICLFIPVVNWVVELLIRWATFVEKKDIISLILAILSVPGGIIIGWLDAIWDLLFGHFVLAA